MALFNNNSAISYRNYSAATTAIGLTFFLIWILSLDEEKIVSRENKTALVTTIKMNPNFATSGTIGLKFDNNKEVEVYININPFPIVGGFYAYYD